MFDGLGVRAQTSVPTSRGAATAGRVASTSTEGKVGKGHVPTVEKNMPSIVGVLGDVDRLYRPEVAEYLFGPPSEVADAAAVAHGRERANERSENASGDRVVIKAYNSNNQLDDTTRRHRAGTAPPLVESSSTSPPRPSEDVNCISLRRSGASQRHAVKQLQQRALMLEHHLHACDRRVKSRETDIKILQGLRDLHIAKKKTRLANLIKDHETIDRQARTAASALSDVGGNRPAAAVPPSSFIASHFSHRAAEAYVNHNPLTKTLAAPTFHAGVGIPGESGEFSLPIRHRRQHGAAQNTVAATSSSAKNREIQSPMDNTTSTNEGAVKPSNSVDVSSNSNTPLDERPSEKISEQAPPHHDTLCTRKSDAWRGATTLCARALMDRVAVPPVSSTRLRGPRYFPHAHNSLAPYAAQDLQAMPRRSLTHVSITNPVQWLERQASRSVTDFNRSIVFTPNLRREPMQVRTNTIPFVVPPSAGTSSP